MSSESSGTTPSQIHDIFIHQEGSQTVAYQAGDPIAKLESGGQERFYAELHVWMRKHRFQGAIWRVRPDGELEPDPELAKRVAEAFKTDTTAIQSMEQSLSQE